LLVPCLQSSPFISERPTTDAIGGEVEVFNITDGDWLHYDNWNLLNIQSIRVRAYRYLWLGLWGFLGVLDRILLPES
jgi:hypothetical protein